MCVILYVMKLFLTPKFKQRQGLASIAEYKTYVDKLPQLVKKKDSTSMFMKLLGIVQRHQSDYFFVRFSECEQGNFSNKYISISSLGEIRTPKIFA